MPQITTRAVFLDRDGVINRAFVRDGRPYPPADLAALEVLPGVHDALQRLRNAGFLLLVVTNQPDVARGIQTRETVERIHAVLQSTLPIDAFYVCYHTDADGCVCRKPAPGMLLEATRRYHIDLAASYMIGDRWRDVEAGQRAGCTSLFIDYKYAEPLTTRPDDRVASLAEGADWILDTVIQKGAFKAG
jgi:D-glycero-D-manno-heptose 1,7-bisphosphate phosphatase